MKKIITVILSLIIVLSVNIMPCVSATSVSSQDDFIENSEQISSQITAQTPMYLDYIGKFADAIYPNSEITVLDSTVALSQGNSYGTVLNVAQAGLYSVEITYSVKEGSSAPAVSLSLNGEIPFEEAANITLYRSFYDKEDISSLGLTSDTIPSIEDRKESKTVFLTDTVGYFGSRLEFYLPSGNVDFALELLSGEVEIENIKFKQYTQAEKYNGQTVKQKADVYSGETVYVEAEYASARSDSSIYAINDSSSAGVSPSNPYLKYLNTLGGTSWQKAGQYIEWTIDVPQDALYQIAIKYRQSDNIGLNSHRRILIDGNVPYMELEEYAFDYSSGFSNEILNVNGEPMLFYLEKGKHTLRMEVVIGELAEILPFVDQIVAALNDSYRQIIMVTGTEVDALRDYNLDTAIPETIETLKAQKESLEKLIKTLEEISGGGSEGVKIMGTLAEQLGEFVDDTYNITQNLSNFKSNVTSLCNWLISARYQPMKIDYFAFAASEESIKSAKASIWETISFQFLSFLYTFSDDYAGNVVTKGDENAITVWVNSGTASYAVARQLVTSDFMVKNPEVTVDIKLVNTSLLNAIIADRAPDVAIGIATTDIMDYAFRNALVDLNRFDDCTQVLSRFRESAVNSVSYKGTTYAVPATEDFDVLYYRKDVLEQLEIEVPTTWDEVVTAMAKLKKKNLEFGITTDNAMFNTMLYQADGKLYNDELTATALTSYEAIEAFTSFTSFFTEYGAPLTFNAQNRFRTGEMPIVISGVSFYNTISVLAPEISGLWGVATVPGTAKEDGSSDHSVVSSGTSSVILNQDKAELCWEFLKWWSSAEVQETYSKQVEMVLGQSARYLTANVEAYLSLDWSSDVKTVIDNASQDLIGVPPVPGSYFMNRHIKNAISAVFYDGEIPGDALLTYSAIIDAEIEYKRNQLGMNQEN